MIAEMIGIFAAVFWNVGLSNEKFIKRWLGSKSFIVKVLLIKKHLNFWESKMGGQKI